MKHLVLFFVFALARGGTASAAERWLECVYSRGSKSKVLIVTMSGTQETKRREFDLSFEGAKPFAKLRLENAQLFAGSPHFVLGWGVSFEAEGVSGFGTSTEEDPHYTFEPEDDKNIAQELYDNPRARSLRVFRTLDQVTSLKLPDGVQYEIACRRCAPLQPGACRSDEEVRKLDPSKVVVAF